MSDVDAVLDWWFGDWDDAVPLPDDSPQMRRWWSGAAEVDAEVIARWGDLHAQAVTGALDGWADTARGRLALTLLLDQGSRVIGRGTAAAFAQDAKARALTKGAIAVGHDQALSPIERVFQYIPLMHSEDLDDHVRATELYEQLVADTEGLVRAGYYSYTLDFEHKHRVIIERFGRYPHRNEALGRVTTPEEAAFLEGPDSSF